MAWNRRGRIQFFSWRRHQMYADVKKKKTKFAAFPFTPSYAAIRKTTILMLTFVIYQKGKFWWTIDAGIQVFDPVRQWPYLGLTDRVFLTSVSIPQSHRPGFFSFLFFFTFSTWDVSDYTTDPVCETVVWWLTSKSKIYKKKQRSDRLWYGHWH